jgi:hypothetical protein
MSRRAARLADPRLVLAGLLAILALGASAGQQLLATPSAGHNEVALALHASADATAGVVHRDQHPTAAAPAVRPEIRIPAPSGVGLVGVHRPTHAGRTGADDARPRAPPR